MNSIITKVTPIATQVGTASVMVISGSHFTDGGNPTVRIDSVAVTPSSFTDTQITVNIPTSMVEGIHDVVVLNGALT